MGRIHVWGAAILVAAGLWTPVAAQTATEGEWDVYVAPYLMGAAMNGTTALRGSEVEIEASASDIFSNLQFGAMGMMTARRGNWGFGADAIWMALGATVRNTNIDFNQGAFAFYGLRRLGPAADVTFGMRVNMLQGAFKFKGPDFEIDQDKTWADPLVGVTVHSPSGRRVLLRAYSEIGGFGLGSDLTWQVFPTVGVRLTDRLSLEFGYRWLDVDYSTGEGNEEFRYDVLTQGPVGGFGLRF